MKINIFEIWKKEEELILKIKEMSFRKRLKLAIAVIFMADIILKNNKIKIEDAKNKKVQEENHNEF